MLIGWYLGIALKLVITGKLAHLGWARRLPFFAASIAWALFQSIALAATYHTPANLTIWRIASPIASLLTLAATVEAFWWCAENLSKFRYVGFWLMAVCTLLSLVFQIWTVGVSVADVLIKSLAEMERAAGFFLFFFLVVALSVYSIFKKIPQAARRHSACLAVISVVNAVGWHMVERGMSKMLLIQTLTWGTTATLGAWLLLVHAAPTGKEPVASPPYDREEMAQGWKAIRRAAGR